MQYLLDTNICIYIIKEKPAQVIAKFRQAPINTITISSVTVAELEYGIEKSAFPQRNRQALYKFLLPIIILPFDEDAAQHYGALRASLEQAGKTIGPLDMLIAAHALSENLIVITNNEREFGRVHRLKMENSHISTLSAAPLPSLYPLYHYHPSFKLPAFKDAHRMVQEILISVVGYFDEAQAAPVPDTQHDEPEQRVVK